MFYSNQATKILMENRTLGDNNNKDKKRERVLYERTSSS